MTLALEMLPGISCLLRQNPPVNDNGEGVKEFSLEVTGVHLAFCLLIFLPEQRCHKVPANINTVSLPRSVESVGHRLVSSQGSNTGPVVTHMILFMSF